jgi:hypothetical protein
MVTVKTVKIDGKSIFVFNSEIYIIESIEGYTLELDIVVSEVTLRKYQREDTLIVEIELEDGSLISSIMDVKVLPGKLPQLNLFCEIVNLNDYPTLRVVNENDSEFPNVEKTSITIETIRKVEMPNERINVKLNLPIDQVEWLQKHKSKELNQLFKELIYDFWRQQK